MNTSKKLIAEILGTFALALTVLLLTVSKNGSAVPVLVAIILALSVVTLGGISGGYFNPALTIGAMLVKKLSVKKGLLYILAQFIGAGIAYGIVEIMTVGSTLHSVFAPIVAGQTLSIGFLFAEMIGMFFFALVVSAATNSILPENTKALFIGLALFFGVTLASAMGSLGILNPALAFALTVFNPMYLLGSVLGSVLAFLLGEYLFSTK